MRSIREFVLAPVPKQIQVFAEKFPAIKKTFEEVGIKKITDISKLESVQLSLPMLNQVVGEFGIIEGIPIAQMTAKLKERIPTDIVFAKTGGEFIDETISLSFNSLGEVEQSIDTIVGQSLKLVVKPDSPVKRVRGFVVLKKKKTEPSSLRFPLNYLTASLVLPNPILTEPEKEIEEELVLQEFEYTDPDGDGIYTAEINMPVVEGEYEIITVTDYVDVNLPSKEIRLITIVDPEGYIYNKVAEGKVRIEGAVVELYWLNPENKEYEPWFSEKYQQKNPIVTDDTGRYSFLVPPGMYYLTVKAPKYAFYQSDVFSVAESNAIHMNIQLDKKNWWSIVFDWKAIGLILLTAIILLNFYRDKIRERLFLKRSTNIVK